VRIADLFNPKPRPLNSRNGKVYLRKKITGKPTVETPEIPDEWKDDLSSTKARVGEYYLPGLGKTYLDPEFADRLGAFLQKTKAKVISLGFESGYRDQVKQDALKNDPTAITSAEHSLHSAGRGVDIAKSQWKGMTAQARAAVLEAAKEAGLSWGGYFSKPDPIHFYSDPGTDRRRLIDKFSHAIAASREEIPDR
jgi:hypothetical protein